MKKLAVYFSLLVAVLLVGSAITFGSGKAGLDNLNASFEGVVKNDVGRLMSITDIRRRIRSRLLLERDLILQKDPNKVAAMVPDFAKAEKGIADETAHYEQFLVEADRERWAALKATVAAQGEIDQKVVAAAVAGDADAAAKLSASHDPRWEGLIKELIGVAQKRLDTTSAEAAALYESSSSVQWIVFLASVLIGLVAGTMIYRGIKKMVGQVVTLKDQLLAANAGLESTVEERTRTIRAILDHVQFGFFIVGKDLKVSDGYSRSLEVLVGRHHLGGQPVGNALGLDVVASASLDLAIEQCFDDILPDDVACTQLPSRFTLNGRILDLQASIVRDASGAIGQILFGLSDVTELEAAARSTREAQAVLRALKSPQSFRMFVNDVSHRFEAARDAIATANEGVARRELHTIKGNVGCYGLVDLAAEAHKVEEQSPIPMTAVVDLEHAFDSFLASHADVLGMGEDARGREVFRLGADDLAEIEAIVHKSSSLDGLRTELTARLERLRWRRADEFTPAYDALVASLASRLGKDVRMHVTGGDVTFLPARVMPVLAIVPHLVRNAIDHGFERPGSRGTKAPIGTLHVIFEESKDAWRVIVADDGAGIDLGALRQRAVEKGILGKDEVIDDERLASLVFVPKLSTAADVTDISGRGEGMGAVADAVRRVDGAIVVKTAIGAGVTVQIEIPKRASPSMTGRPPTVSVARPSLAPASRSERRPEPRALASVG